MAILGSGGAGKSRLATALGARTGLPVVHLDQRYWGPGWTPMAEEDWEVVIRELAAADEWIIDGNYSPTLPARLARADTVVFLDLPRLVCLWAVTRRAVRYRGRSRPDMAEGVNENLRPEFLRWIWDYPSKSRPRILERLSALPPEVRVVRLRSRRAVRDWLAAVPAPGETAA